MKAMNMAPATLHGGVHPFYSTGTGTPMNWDYGQRVLEEFLNPVMGYDEAIRLVGEAVLEQYKAMLRGDEHQGPPPVSEDTLSARRNSSGSGGQGVLNDTGDFADSLQVTLKKSSIGRSGVAGFAIEVMPGPASHKSQSMITNIQMINQMADTGLVLYASDLGPEKVKKIMAWRDRNFTGEGSYKDNITPAGDESEHPGAVVFIPPRDMFPDNIDKVLNETATVVAGAYFTNLATIARRTLGQERFDETSLTRYRARKALIETKKRFAPWVLVKE